MFVTFVPAKTGLQVPTSTRSHRGVCESSCYPLFSQPKVMNNFFLSFSSPQNKQANKGPSVRSTCESRRIPAFKVP